MQISVQLKKVDPTTKKKLLKSFVINNFFIAKKPVVKFAI
jgi:hypothetical protein